MQQSIEIKPFYVQDPDIEEIGNLYCLTFLQKDYALEEKENAINNITKHAGYEGFTGLKAKNAKGNVVGFAYGYTSLPQQFYRQKIEKQLSEAEINKWLSNCFEFVELAVSPSYKRLGIASALHDTLLEKAHENTSVLTTEVENFPALQLYRNKGWKVIKKAAPIISEDHLQMIMGKEIT